MWCLKTENILKKLLQRCKLHILDIGSQHQFDACVAVENCAHQEKDTGKDTGQELIPDTRTQKLLEKRSEKRNWGLNSLTGRKATNLARRREKTKALGIFDISQIQKTDICGAENTPNVKKKIIEDLPPYIWIRGPVKHKRLPEDALDGRGGLSTIYMANILPSRKSSLKSTIFG